MSALGASRRSAQSLASAHEPLGASCTTPTTRARCASESGRVMLDPTGTSSDSVVWPNSPRPPRSHLGSFWALVRFGTADTCAMGCQAPSRILQEPRQIQLCGKLCLGLLKGHPRSFQTLLRFGSGDTCAMGSQVPSRTLPRASSDSVQLCDQSSLGLLRTIPELLRTSADSEQRAHSPWVAKGQVPSRLPPEPRRSQQRGHMCFVRLKVHQQLSIVGL